MKSATKIMNELKKMRQNIVNKCPKFSLKVFRYINIKYKI